jgi:hypothetical protein
MNLQEKTKLFGHFIFCEVKAGETTITMQSIDGNTGCVNSLGNAIQLPIEECKLILKPLSKISRKHAAICAEIAGLPASLFKNWTVQTNIYNQAIFSFPGDDNYRNMITFTEDKLSWKQCNFLRSMSYAVGVPNECYVIEEKL